MAEDTQVISDTTFWIGTFSTGRFNDEQRRVLGILDKQGCGIFYGGPLCSGKWVGDATYHFNKCTVYHNSGDFRLYSSEKNDVEDAAKSLEINLEGLVQGRPTVWQ